MMYLNDGIGPRRTVDPAVHLVQGAVWVDLEDPTEEERAAAERVTGLRVPSREEVAEIESSSRLYTSEGVLYLSMPYGSLAPDGLSRASPVGFVLSERCLLTLRFARLPAFESYAESYAHGGARTPLDSLVGLAEAVMARLADVLERVSAELDQVSKATFGGKTLHKSIRRADRELRALLTRVGLAGDTLGVVRNGLLGLGRLTGYVQQEGGQWLVAGTQARLATLKADIASLVDVDQQLTAKVGFLLDAVLGYINIEQNNGVKVLTIASVVGIPPTFVVGLYGMNFKNMPEYDWHYGYQYGWAMILLSVVVPLVWFRIKGWL